ncbi:MAG: hypothetical protein Alpg2KO_08470 [Alphaproteobacteria bacterium]
MFTVSQGVVAELDLSGLTEPPQARGFSTNIANSYFSQDGIDVSLVWIDANLHAKMMQQHRDNLRKATLVTVRQIDQVTLGGTQVTQVIYDKSRPVPDLTAPGEIVQGAETTWQYIWPADSGDSHALLTIWRSGQDAPETLEQGFEQIKDRWQAGPALPGTVIDLNSQQVGHSLVLTATAVTAPRFDWGRIRVPTFYGHDDWQVELNAPTLSNIPLPNISLPETPLLLDIPGIAAEDDVMAELAQLEQWIKLWSPTLQNLPKHIQTAAQTCLKAIADHANASDTQLSLLDLDFDRDSRTLRLDWQIIPPDGIPQDALIHLNPDGSLHGFEVF